MSTAPTPEPAAPGSQLSTRVSRHCAERYCQRVEPGACLSRATTQIDEILRRGRRRPNARRWLGTRLAPGTVAVIWAERPGIAVLVRNGVAVTVITQALGRGRRRPERATGPKRRRGTSSRWSYTHSCEGEPS